MGMALSTEIDTDSLPTPQSEELAGMVKTCGFFDLPPELRTNTGGADRFEYEITVEDKQRNHTVKVSEAAAPPSLQLLLDALARITRSKRLSE